MMFPRIPAWLDLLAVVYRGVNFGVNPSPRFKQTVAGMLAYSLASTKTSLDPVVSDLRMSGTLFFRSSWKSISGPSDALPVDLSIPDISPVLSTLGSSLCWCCSGLGSSAGVSS